MSTQVEREDPLFNLRLSIKTNSAPILANTATPSAAADTVTELAQATHISFNVESHHKTFDITIPTRYKPGDEPIDLRSVYFAWLNKDAQVTEYVAAVQQLNEDLPSGAGGSVVNLNFAQRIELVSWLSGEVDASENITPLESAATITAAADAIAIAGGKGVPIQTGTTTGGPTTVDARLLEIYDGERITGDHNTILRGSKQLDFSVYRKAASMFLNKRSDLKPAPGPQPLVSGLTKKPRRHEQPIILLSPSASSLLRMSNIKSFLEEGIFIPPNTLDATTANFLQMPRLLPSISSTPFRFILVDSTSMFKPPYWSRVVAIFTTGQPWQFKSYKYPNPVELFSHYPGVHVGWQGEKVPENITAWGRNVISVSVDKWTGSEKGRWRDREVVERIWATIEEGMRRSGWTKDGPAVVGQPAGH